MYSRWRYVVERLPMPYREPYNARHTSVTMNLMIGKNFVWVADQHGHSPEEMFKTYAQWQRGATEDDIEAIRRAMVAEATAARLSSSPQVPPDPRLTATKLPPGERWGRLSWRKISQRTGGADGTRTRDPRRDRPVF